MILKPYLQENVSIKYLDDIIFNSFKIRLTQSKIARILNNDRYTLSFSYRDDFYKSSIYGLKEIITKDEFEVIQNKLSSRQKKKYTYFLKNKLYCSECNSILIAKPTKKKKGVYVYYECNNNSCNNYNKRINQNIVLGTLSNKITRLYNKHNFSFSDK